MPVSAPSLLAGACMSLPQVAWAFKLYPILSVIGPHVTACLPNQQGFASILMLVQRTVPGDLLGDSLPRRLAKLRVHVNAIYYSNSLMSRQAMYGLVHCKGEQEKLKRTRLCVWGRAIQLQGLNVVSFTHVPARNAWHGGMQWKRSYKRNDKAICSAALKFLAHLTNQEVVHEMLVLDLIVLMLDLDNLTGDD